ncbi:MAG: beta-lactamase family protein [Candidatus Latescibacteria bacterium]|nr:beta-lactamase family protein [Candidatus Latescibacterota bacterium]
MDDLIHKMGFDPEKLDCARLVLVDHVAQEATPGAVGLVLHRGGVVARWAVGAHTYDLDASPVLVDDVFDLASVTKAVVTTTLCALFVDSGRLDLDASVQTYVPEFIGEGKVGVTARHLLAHCSGLPAHIHLYKEHIGRDDILDAVCGLELAYVPGTDTVYSDMGFLLLGMVLEAIGGARLDRLARQYVFDPLGMKDACYCPREDLKSRILPTEVKTHFREGLVWSEVHDENAAAMGGIASHAGVFATADDLAGFVQMWLCGGVLDGMRVLSEDVVDLFTRRADLAPASTWALGWDTVSSGGSSSGRYFSERSFGSLGFTGTSIWIDPERDLGVVLLTNRVHPTRDNWKIKALRPAFHDAVSEALRE